MKEFLNDLRTLIAVISITGILITIAMIGDGLWDLLVHRVGRDTAINYTVFSVVLFAIFIYLLMIPKPKL